MSGLVQEVNWSTLTQALSEDQVLVPGTEAYSEASRFHSPIPHTTTNKTSLRW